uniref:WH2 domain-containing protein n=1 Tax=Ascaris lumbricoides TaxID=6252 RepID=A0A0M3IA24_ASCLU
MGDEYEELGPAQVAPPPPAPNVQGDGAPVVPPPPPPPNTVPPPPPPPFSGSVQKQPGRDERTELESEKGEPSPAIGDVKGQGSNFSPFSGETPKQVIPEEESDDGSNFSPFSGETPKQVIPEEESDDGL